MNNYVEAHAMKLLFAAMPFDGHFEPLTRIAKQFAEAGHDVRWYAGASYASRLERLGIGHYPFARAREVNGENIGELLPERAELSGPKLISFEFENVFIANCEAHFQDIAAIRNEFEFDALFADEAFYATKLIAEKLGVPVYGIGVSPLMFNSRDAPPSFFGLKPARTFVGRVHHRIIDAMVNSTMKPGLKRFNELLAREGLTPLASPREFFDIPAKASTAFFQSGVPGFEYPRTDLPANVKFVGPLLPYRDSVPSTVDSRVADASSVIVVSQGTVDNKDPQKLIVPALEALAGSRHTVVVTTGGEHTSELRKQFPADNVIIEDYLDFDALFEHADLFICNGGYGSVMSALSKGVPILAAGKREGKADINARIAYFGVGVDLRTEKPRAGRIAKTVERLLADRPLPGRLDRLQAELAAYDPIELIASEVIPEPSAIRGPRGQVQELSMGYG